MNVARHAGLSGEVSTLLDDVDRFNREWTARVAHRVRELGVLHTRAMRDRVAAVEILLAPACSATLREDVSLSASSGSPQAYAEGLDLVFTYGPEMPLARGTLGMFAAVIGNGAAGAQDLAASVLDEWVDWVRARLADRTIHPVIVIGLLGGTLLARKAFGEWTLPVVLLVSTWLLRSAGYEFTAYCAIEQALVETRCGPRCCRDSEAASPSDRSLERDWVERLIHLLHRESSKLECRLHRPSPG